MSPDGNGRFRWWVLLVPATTMLLSWGAVASPLAVEHRPKRHVVEIRGFEFRPAVLEVAAGDTVVWINRDLAPHTATGTGNARWDTGTLSEGEQGSYIAEGEGEQPYYCELHPIMKGKLIVRGSDG